MPLKSFWQFLSIRLRGRCPETIDRRIPMANVTRWHPFEDSFDDIVKGLFLRPVRYETEQPVSVKVDVKETEKSYTVQAEIPGVKKEDIQVSVDGNQVAISAEIKREKEEKQGEKVLRTERY